MSGGTYAPAACPRCRGPLAYGQATPTRMYARWLDSWVAGWRVDCSSCEPATLPPCDLRPTSDSRLTISASFRGDPNVQHITHIVPSIPSRAHLAPLAIAPDDRHRADAITIQPGNGQQLDVEGRHARSSDDLLIVTV